MSTAATTNPSVSTKKDVNVSNSMNVGGSTVKERMQEKSERDATRKELEKERERRRQDKLQQQQLQQTVDEEDRERITKQNNIVQQWKDKAKRRQSRVGGQGPIRFRTTFNNTILDVLKGRGWKETSSETDWDLLWTHRDWIRNIYDKVHLDAHQRVNHFRNFFELTRKDLLIKNLKRAKRSLDKRGRHEESAQYNFFPETFSLPAEYLLFVEHFKKNENTIWIMKPIGSSQGKGIFLFDRLSQINDWRNDSKWKPDDQQAEKYIVQRYISNPLLIGGKKFDLRIYVLCVGYQPLTCYMYREGFARFSSTRFSMLKGDIKNSYVHLTNVAIQKKGEDYDPESGGKWDVRSLKLYLISKFGVERVNKCFVDIQMICIRSLLAVQKVIINDKHSFELYGYDILLDDNLKPWLIEVNASPSLTANTPKDYAMKYQMLTDTISIVDVDQKLTGTEEQVGGFDLIYRGGFVKFDHNCTTTSYLGAHNNRAKQLVQLHKSLARQQQQQQQQHQQQSTQAQSALASQSQQSTDKDKEKDKDKDKESNKDKESRESNSEKSDKHPYTYTSGQERSSHLAK